MMMSNSGWLKKAAVLVAVAVLTGVIGAVVSAQMGPGRGQAMSTGQGMGMGPGGQGMGPGMGRGMRGGPGGPGGGPFGILGPGMRELNLTDAQHEQIRGIVEKHQEEFKAINEGQMKARRALEEAVMADAINEGAIRDAALELGKAEGEAAVLRAKVHAEAFGVLTDEQKLKAKEIRTQMEQRMKDGRGGMRQRMHQRPAHRPAPPQESQQQDTDPSRPEMV